MHDYENNRWGLAFAALGALADAGDRDAALRAWLMSRHGISLYRTRLDADSARRQRWLVLAVERVPALQLAAAGWAPAIYSHR